MCVRSLFPLLVSVVYSVYTDSVPSVGFCCVQCVYGACSHCCFLLCMVCVQSLLPELVFFTVLSIGQFRPGAHTDFSVLVLSLREDPLPPIGSD